MASQRRHSEFGFVRLDGRRTTPLVQQLYEAIRDAILNGTLKPNTRIPSSRDLVEQLGISRTTVINALDRLKAEGYLQSAHGSGTYVSSELPDDGHFSKTNTGRRFERHAFERLPNSVIKGRDRNSTSAAPQLGTFGEQYVTLEQGTLQDGVPKAFCPGEPALDEFPVEIWSRIVRRVWRDIGTWELSYGQPAGIPELRTAVAEYLRSQRGVDCEAEQVMIVAGTQQAIELTARLLLNPGDKVLFEEPGYVSAREIFTKRSADVVAVEVDDGGMLVERGLMAAPEAKLAYVTPSHQYPLGVTLSIERRLELLAWASQFGAWILEDDYDSEYRYGQPPIPCLQGLGGSRCTFYVGSFSKVIFPALGMGYVIVPPEFVRVFENALRLSSRPVSQIDQLVLCEFLREGHFVRHLRRMRKTHAERRRVFVQELERLLAGKLQIIGSPAGLHCTALLKHKKSDRRLAEELATAGIVVRPLSQYYCQTGSSRKGSTVPKSGLVFGFACASPESIRKSMATVARIL